MQIRDLYGAPIVVNQLFMAHVQTILLTIIRGGTGMVSYKLAMLQKHMFTLTLIAADVDIAGIMTENIVNMKTTNVILVGSGHVHGCSYIGWYTYYNYYIQLQSNN